MGTCSEYVYSEDYYDLLLYNSDKSELPQGIDGCELRAGYEISSYYADRRKLPPLSIANYTYSAIPDCYSVLSMNALEATGILKVQNIPVLGLSGQGVIIGLVDTGIDYENTTFMASDGSTRIRLIWDQSIVEGDSESVPYGKVYTKEDIDNALNSGDKLETVDVSGHGTAVASIAAGRTDITNDFSGAAPRAEIAMVKLKRAKKYFYDFWHLSEDEECYQENDIILGVAYLLKISQELKKPLVLCITLGSNMGSRDGDGLLARYLDKAGEIVNVAIVIGAGNEATARHHFGGSLYEYGVPGIDPVLQSSYQQVEVSVGSAVGGFVMELWAKAPELYSIQIESPTGEKTPRYQGRIPSDWSYRFLYEDTQLTIDYRSVGVQSARQLIFFRFTNPSQGLWNIYVYPEQIFAGRYEMYLPMTSQLKGDVIFLDSSPDETITSPGVGVVPMTVGGVDTRNGGIYSASGRGYTQGGYVKPDFSAPAVNISAISTRGIMTELTGTSAAAAITAGAVAIFMEWAVVRKNIPGINSVDIKNYFIRGARRNPSNIYPNRETGYGILDLYNTFDKIRLS